MLAEMKRSFEKIQRTQNKLPHPLELPADPLQFKRQHPVVWSQAFLAGEGPVMAPAPLMQDASWRCRGNACTMQSESTFSGGVEGSKGMAAGSGSNQMAMLSRERRRRKWAGERRGA